MPELPDVETFRRYFDSTSLYQTISETEVKRKDLLEDISENDLKSSLEQRYFEHTKRHGKFMFAGLNDGNFLVLHFGMTGFLKYFKRGDKKPEYTRFLVFFENGYHLAYSASRVLGQIGFTDDPETFIEKKELGPDPHSPDFSYEDFSRILDNHKRSSLKSFFMNQNIIAGIGNVYSDEIFFQAKVHPKKKVGKLDKEDKKKLYEMMNHVLKVSIDAQAQLSRFPDNFILPRREEGENCPVCGTELRKEKISGRGVFYCPVCQKDNSEKK